MKRLPFILLVLSILIMYIHFSARISHLEKLQSTYELKSVYTGEVK